MALPKNAAPPFGKKKGGKMAEKMASFKRGGYFKKKGKK